jgi:acetylglutamate kinase
VLRDWNLYNIIEADDFDAEKAHSAISEYLKSDPTVVHETMNYIEGRAEQYKKEYMRIQSLKKEEEERLDFIKKSMLSYLEENDIKKIETSIGKISRRRTQPKMRVLDESKIPEEYFKIERKPKLKEIRSAIKNNELDKNIVEFIESQAIFRK